MSKIKSLLGVLMLRGRLQALERNIATTERRLRAAARAAAETSLVEIDVVMDGPPGPEAGRFVEVETTDGRSIVAGEWIDRGDGFWALRIPRAIDSALKERLAEAELKAQHRAREVVHYRDTAKALRDRVEQLQADRDSLSAELKAARTRDSDTLARIGQAHDEGVALWRANRRAITGSDEPTLPPTRAELVAWLLEQLSLPPESRAVALADEGRKAAEATIAEMLSAARGERMSGSLSGVVCEIRDLRVAYEGMRVELDHTKAALSRARGDEERRRNELTDALNAAKVPPPPADLLGGDPIAWRVGWLIRTWENAERLAGADPDSPAAEIARLREVVAQREVAIAGIEGARDKAIAERDELDREVADLSRVLNGVAPTAAGTRAMSPIDRVRWTVEALELARGKMLEMSEVISEIAKIVGAPDSGPREAVVAAVRARQQAHETERKEVLDAIREYGLTPDDGDLGDNVKWALLRVKHKGEDAGRAKAEDLIRRLKEQVDVAHRGLDGYVPRDHRTEVTRTELDLNQRIARFVERYDAATAEVNQRRGELQAMTEQRDRWMRQESESVAHGAKAWTAIIEIAHMLGCPENPAGVVNRVADLQSAPAAWREAANHAAVGQANVVNTPADLVARLERNIKQLAEMMGHRDSAHARSEAARREIDDAHEALDNTGVPRTDDGGNVYNLRSRIARLAIQRNEAVLEVREIGHVLARRGVGPAPTDPYCHNTASCVDKAIAAAEPAAALSVAWGTVASGYRRIHNLPADAAVTAALLVASLENGAAYKAEIERIRAMLVERLTGGEDRRNATAEALVAFLCGRYDELDERMDVLTDSDKQATTDIATILRMPEGPAPSEVSAAVNNLADRVTTIADEAFGPFPVQSPDDALTAIERGIFELRQRANRREGVVAYAERLADAFAAGEQVAQAFRNLVAEVKLYREDEAKAIAALERGEATSARLFVSVPDPKVEDAFEERAFELSEHGRRVSKERLHEILAMKPNIALNLESLHELQLMAVELLQRRDDAEQFSAAATYTAASDEVSERRMQRDRATYTPPERAIWECKIGEVERAKLPRASDAPMRAAVAKAFRELTGEEPAFVFSGWGAELTEGERRVVDATTTTAGGRTVRVTKVEQNTLGKAESHAVAEPLPGPVVRLPILTPEQRADVNRRLGIGTSPIPVATPPPQRITWTPQTHAEAERIRAEKLAAGATVALETESIEAQMRADVVISIDGRIVKDSCAYGHRAHDQAHETDPAIPSDADKE